MRTMAVFAVTAGVLAGCTPAQNGAADGIPPASIVSNDSRVSLERQPCFGFCPIYRVSIDAAGLVTFEGERHVDSTGTRTRQIDPTTAAALMNELSSKGFFELDSAYTMGAKNCGPYHTDAPRVILTLNLNGREKTVEHDYGCQGAPPSLRAMQERVDSVAGVSRWVGER